MQVTVDVPERYLVDTDAAELGKRFKLLSALLMYQSGELSAGAACELAEVNRYEFLAACQRYSIETQPMSSEELENELQGLQTALSC